MPTLPPPHLPQIDDAIVRQAVTRLWEQLGALRTTLAACEAQLATIAALEAEVARLTAVVRAQEQQLQIRQ